MMADLFTDLVALTQGTAQLIQPLIPSQTEAWTVKPEPPSLIVGWERTVERETLLSSSDKATPDALPYPVDPRTAPAPYSIDPHAAPVPSEPAARYSSAPPFSFHPIASRPPFDGDDVSSRSAKTSVTQPRQATDSASLTRSNRTHQWRSEHQKREINTDIVSADVEGEIAPQMGQASSPSASHPDPNADRRPPATEVIAPIVKPSITSLGAASTNALDLRSTAATRATSGRINRSGLLQRQTRTDEKSPTPVGSPRLPDDDDRQKLAVTSSSEVLTSHPTDSDTLDMKVSKAQTDDRLNTPPAHKTSPDLVAPTTPLTRGRISTNPAAYSGADRSDPLAFDGADRIDAIHNLTLLRLSGSAGPNSTRASGDSTPRRAGVEQTQAQRATDSASGRR